MANARPPAIGPNLQVVFIISIINFGAPSSAVGYKVSALSPNGMHIDAEVFQTDALAFTMESGTIQADYNQSDYIMNRTASPVARGAPVIGALPVVFRKVTSLKEIDMRTFKVRFTDGTGTRERRAKWWETEPIPGAYEREGRPEMRPTLSPLRPVPPH